jgi:hypothetical protein
MLALRPLSVTLGRQMTCATIMTTQALLFGCGGLPTGDGWS